MVWDVRVSGQLQPSINGPSHTPYTPRPYPQNSTLYTYNGGLTLVYIETPMNPHTPTYMRTLVSKPQTLANLYINPYIKFLQSPIDPPPQERLQSSPEPLDPSSSELLKPLYRGLGVLGIWIQEGFWGLGGLVFGGLESWGCGVFRV